MEKKPLYRSIRESYSRDIYMPVCGITAAPVVITEILQASDLTKLTGERPPQNAILHIDEKLQLKGSDGNALSSLEAALRMCARTVPVLYFDSAEAGNALAEFVDFHNLGDTILCTPFQRRDVLAAAYKKMPLLRGMLDARNCCADISALPGIAVSCGATSVILTSDAADDDSVNSLQRRFIHVVTDDACGFATAAVRGVNGIITADSDSAYDFLAKFPEGSLFRRRKLIAHKGFSYGGRYSENTINAVVAAGENHLDGAEIDIKLTGDDVPIVMHNLNTVGLFECGPLITEEADYAQLAGLRRIGFPEEGVDKFEDLMHAMREYTETPVLIEIKPSAKYNNVEEMVRLITPILASPFSQQNCICIMGELDPGHEYLHRKLPSLPISYCEGSGTMPPPPDDRAGAEDCIYRIARLTRGCAAGYNGEDVSFSRMLNEYAKFRMINMFPWSRSWTLEPSKWEEHGPDNCRTYLAGYDAWTTDHAEKFMNLPVKIAPDYGFEYRAGMPFRPRCRMIFRDGSERACECGILAIEGEVQALPDGSCIAAAGAKVMCWLDVELYFSESYRIFSEPFVISR